MALKTAATSCRIALIWLAISYGALQGSSYEWLETARIFLIDAYQYPFAPRLEFEAEAIAEVMARMNVNTVRMATMGKYATIQGVRFSTHHGQGERDLLKEMIEACKPRGIRVVPYISTGHKLAWSMVTETYPEYAHQPSPGARPSRSHMYAGEDHGTVCWNTPYRKAYLDLVEHVVRDYEIDGIYFDTWKAFYFYPEPGTCYCPGCREGFRRATGLEIPYEEKLEDYSREELAVIDRYHAWYQDELVSILAQVRSIVKKYRDIPLIYNINDPEKITTEDPRVIANMDAFLYERGRSLLERAEGVSLARAAGLAIWPYVGSYDNWPRTIHNGLDYQQEIFTTAVFGGGPIISQPYAFLNQPDKRWIVADAFKLLDTRQEFFRQFVNLPHVAVVYGFRNPPGHARKGWWWEADVRSSTLGAFAACLYRHIQVSSVLENLLDRPEEMKKYKVLYLADIPYLSPQRVQNIELFVEQGGALIASYATSLYDARGRKNGRFGLEKLIGVRPLQSDSPLQEKIENYTTMVGGPNDLYLRVEKPAADKFAEWPDRLVPLWFYEPVEALDGAEVVADIVTGDGLAPLLPGLVVSRHGKGKVAYLASSLESLFIGSNIQELADFLASVIDYVAAEPPPYLVEGPECLIANMTVRGNMCVLHLVNWTGNKLERNWANEYYLAPLENIRLLIRVPDGKTVGNVQTLAEGDYRVRDLGRQLEVILPKMGAYQAVAVTFKEP
ncbi:MAG: beta-galactosidase trimerization domain-containing protein [Candidatus Glassbacteria bacterium]